MQFALGLRELCPPPTTPRRRRATCSSNKLTVEVTGNDDSIAPSHGLFARAVGRQTFVRRRASTSTGLHGVFCNRRRPAASIIRNVRASANGASAGVRPFDIVRSAFRGPRGQVSRCCTAQHRIDGSRRTVARRTQSYTTIRSVQVDCYRLPTSVELLSQLVAMSVECFALQFESDSRHCACLSARSLLFKRYLETLNHLMSGLWYDCRALKPTNAVNELHRLTASVPLFVYTFKLKFSTAETLPN
jgi:hypothetical protein